MKIECMTWFIALSFPQRNCSRIKWFLIVKLIMYTTEECDCESKTCFLFASCMKAKNKWTQRPCARVYGHFGQLKLSFYSPSFFSILGRKLEKTTEPYHLFSLPLPTKQPLKMFFPHFSLLNFLFFLKYLQTNTP